MAVSLAWLGSFTFSLAQSQTLDRILAVAAGHVIMQSDVRAFIEFGLVGMTEGEDVEAAILTRLIERRLILDEVDRYVVADPPEAMIERKLTEVEARFSSEAAFQRALDHAGYTVDDLRQILRNDTRRDAYLDDRFSAVTLPSEEKLREYFEAHETEIAQSGRRLTFAQARPLIVQHLAGKLRIGMLDEWVEELVRRAEIVRMFPAPPQ